MKTKLLSLTAALYLLLLGGGLWWVDQVAFEKQRKALMSHLSLEASSLSHSVAAEVRSARRLIPGNGALTRDRLSWRSLRPFFAFVELRFEPNSTQVLQAVVDEKGPAGTWTSESFNSLFSSWQKDPFENFDWSVKSVRDKAQKLYHVVLFRQDGRVFAGLAGPEFLRSHLDRMKGGESAKAILDQAGLVLAHTTDEYAGRPLSQPAALQEILAQGLSQGQGVFGSGESRPWFGAYDKVPQSDLVVLSTLENRDLLMQRGLQLGAMGLAGLGVLLFGLWLMARFVGDLEGEQRRTLQKSLQQSRLMPARAPLSTANPMAKAASTATSPPASGEKSEAYRKIASAVGHELRGPLTSVVGLAQMLLSRTTDPRLTEPLSQLLTEARQGRERLDKLFVYAGEKTGERIPGQVETVLSKVLQEFEPRFKQKQIKVQKEIKGTSPVPLMTEPLAQALRHLLQNAVEAMERMAKKEIQISLAEEGDQIVVKIKDSGEGIEAHQQQKVFDPFFTTRTTGAHLGLGLTAAAGIMREHGGELKLESDKGKGTTVSLILQKEKKSVQIGDETVVLKTEEKVDIPSQLPSVETPKPAEILKPVGPADADKTVAVSKAPTDFDIESLLELPEARSSSSASSGNTEASSAEPEPAGADEFEFLMNQGAAPKAAAPAATSNPASTSTSPTKPPATDDEATVVLSSEDSWRNVALDDKIGAPQFQAPQRQQSKLDLFPVQIRRPGEKLT